MIKISKEDYKKYSKQILLKQIGFAGQKKIFKSKVLVVGAGGLGCPLLIYLANFGVRNIGVIDDDTVEISNLNRQILFNHEDIGKYKVDRVKKKLKLINPKIILKTYKTRLNMNNIKKIFSNFEIICDGSDNYTTRLLINDYSKKMKKILISAAISRFSGHLFKFNFKKKTPCYRCFMPTIPPLEQNCDTEGIASPVAGILGTLQANEVSKTILNVNSDLNGKMIVFDALKSSLRQIKILKNPEFINKC